MSEKCPVCNQPINQCSCGCCKPPTPCPPKSPLTTENYHLPLYRASDVTSWLIQFNNAMIDIDKIMHSLALRTNTVPEVSEELISTVEKLESEVQELQLTSGELVTSNGNLAAQVATAMQSLANANQSIQTLMLNTTNLDTRMGTVETNVQNLQTNFTKLQENVNAVAENYTALTDRVETLEAARTDIEEWQESATETIAKKLDISNATTAKRSWTGTSNPQTFTSHVEVESGIGEEIQEYACIPYVTVIAGGDSTAKIMLCRFTLSTQMDLPNATTRVYIRIPDNIILNNTTNPGNGNILIIDAIINSDGLPIHKGSCVHTGGDVVLNFYAKPATTVAGGFREFSCICMTKDN